MDEEGIDRFLRRREVEELCGINRTTLYEMIKRNQFPKQVRLNPGNVRWSLHEVQAWQRERLAAREATATTN